MFPPRCGVSCGGVMHQLKSRSLAVRTNVRAGGYILDMMVCTGGK